MKLKIKNFLIALKENYKARNPLNAHVEFLGRLYLI